MPTAGQVKGNPPAAKRQPRPETVDPAEPAVARGTPAQPRRPDSPDHAAALTRLDRLLEQDSGEGPKPDAPARGFYLNIVV